MDKRLLAFFVSAVVFVLVFYKKSIGINLAIYEIISFSLLLFLTHEKRSHFFYLFLTGTTLTLAASLWHYSVLSYTLNYFSFFFLVSSLLYSEFKSLLNILLLSLKNIFSSPYYFIKSLNTKKGATNFKVNFKKVSFYIFPIAIIVIFISLYSVSSFNFSQLLNKTVNAIGNFFNLIPAINWVFVGVLLLALFFGSFVFYSQKDLSLFRIDSLLNNSLKRVKRRRYFKPMALAYEYKSAVFLFVILNLLILIVNVTDIWNVWYNFNWSGQYLKEFVHSGTYTLIFSILISMALVIYYFRNNLNFYSKNRFLIILANIWVIQNAVLTISVCVRNLRYIEHFALAYKRIGVFFFLAATLYGLYTVYVKVNQKKSTSYLSRKNALSIYVVLLVMSLFNWDYVIIKYNVNHADRSFLHFNYLSLMSNQSLPSLQKNKEFWDEKEIHQKELFDLRSSSSYMQPNEFVETIDDRVELFLKDYHERSWLEWNYGDWKAYQKLKK